jgi:SNF2 family DNA or RNA helicase
MRIELFDYQTAAINFLLQRKKAGLFLDMGLGKTLIVLSWLQLRKKHLGKILIIAPLRVAENVWVQEIEKWGFKFSISLVLGNEEKRFLALDKKSDIYIINVENVIWLIENSTWDYNTLIIDELSTFKIHNSRRFKALQNVSYEYFVGLTGTPAPNGIHQLWSQIFLIDGGARLGRNITTFRSQFFRFIRTTYGCEFIPRPDAAKAITNRIKDVCISMENINPPAVIFNDVTCKMSKEERALYDEMRCNALVQINIDKIDAENAAVVSTKLRQLASGGLINGGKYHVIHERKLDLLEDVVLAASGSPLMVFYNFVFEREMIKARFKEAKVLDVSTLAAWNKGEISLLLAHPQSAGHGLNLQQGGHLMAWYSLPWEFRIICASKCQACAYWAETHSCY